MFNGTNCDKSLQFFWIKAETLNPRECGTLETLSDQYCGRSFF